MRFYKKSKRKFKRIMTLELNKSGLTIRYFLLQITMHIDKSDKKFT